MTDSEISIEHGNKHPYDNRRGGDWATLAARGIVANLCDRRDIKHGFRDVELDVRRELIETLADIIRTCAP